MVVFFNISAYDSSQCDYGPILASMAKVSSELYYNFKHGRVTLVINILYLKKNLNLKI